QGREGDSVRAHAERLGLGRGADLDCRVGKLPRSGWHGRDPRGAATLYGRHGADFATVNLESQRIRLIMELRAAGITDTEVLAAVERVPRELFVPESFSDHAYENTALPIGMAQTISQPSVVAFMTQALELSDRMK